MAEHPAVLQLPNVKAGVFLLRTPAPVLIDCGMRGQGGRISKALRAVGVSSSDLALIALTHWHIDHAGALKAISARSEARVVAHRADAAIIAGESPPIKPRLTGEGGKFARWLLIKLYAPSRVDMRLEDGETLPDAGGLQAILTPGHTAGHLCYYFPAESALFVGDALVNRNGQLDTSPPGFSDDPALALASLEALRPLRYERCYFGHGEPILSGADARVREFLDQTADRRAAAGAVAP